MLRCAQAFNPPLVHAVAVPSPAWAPRQLGRLAAVARGDGVVAVYDADRERPAVTPRRKAVKVGAHANLCTGYPSSQNEEGHRQYFMICRPGGATLQGSNILEG